MKPILVTGATGNVGLEVVRRLLAAGIPVRAAVTDPQRGRERLERALLENIQKSSAAPNLESELPEKAVLERGLLEKGLLEKGLLETGLLETVRLEFGAEDTYPAAFFGCEACFLMRPPAVSNTKRLMLPAVNAGVAAGTTRWVFLSLQGAEKNPVVPHAAVEKHLERLGALGKLNYTFLRASFFMQNLATTHRDDIRVLHDIYIPAGSGRTAFVDARDIAAVAVKALTVPDLEPLGLKNTGVELTSAEALTYAEVAAIMTQVLGVQITYSNPSNLAFGAHLRHQGMGLAQILVMEALYTAAKLGLAGRLTGEVQRILGRLPISFEQFVRDYAAVWR